MSTCQEQYQEKNFTVQFPVMINGCYLLTHKRTILQYMIQEGESLS